jgi:predicted RNase H-like nuclease
MARLLVPATDNAALASKKTPRGQLEREQLLQRVGFNGLPQLITQGRALGAGADDVLDACAAAWTAARVDAGTAILLPAHPPHDRRGLEMAIWY